MNATNQTFSRRLSRLAAGLLTLLFVAGLTTAPAFGQDNSNQKQQLEQLKQAYAAGIRAAKQNNAQEAITNLEEALRLARATEQQGAAQKIQQYLVELPKQWGNQALKNDNYQAALGHFNEAISHDSTVAYLYYGKGLALINQDQVQPAMQALTKAIQKGEATGDMRTANLATQRIRDHYIAQASQALNATNPSPDQAQQALEYLNEMEQYVDPNAKSYFYRATALYHLDRYQDAIAAAQQGLELFEGSRSEEAKYHFVIGESYVALDNIEAAKEQFRQAAYGDYAPRAQHYLDTLEG